MLSEGYFPQQSVHQGHAQAINFLGLESGLPLINETQQGFLSKRTNLKHILLVLQLF